MIEVGTLEDTPIRGTELHSHDEAMSTPTALSSRARHEFSMNQDGRASWCGVGCYLGTIVGKGMVVV